MRTIIWQDEWQKAGLPEACLFSALEPGAGCRGRLADNHIQEKAVLLVISVRLEPKNLERTAESATALLLANRLTQTALTPLALLHRPECITDTDDGVRHCTGAGLDAGAARCHIRCVDCRTDRNSVPRC